MSIPQHVQDRAYEELRREYAWMDTHVDDSITWASSAEFVGALRDENTWEWQAACLRLMLDDIAAASGVPRSLTRVAEWLAPRLPRWMR